MSVAPLKPSVLLLLLAAAVAAEEQVVVERDAEGVTVRSPADKLNFLFRVPAAFSREPAEGSARVRLVAGTGKERALVLLRVGELTAAEAVADLEALARGRRERYREGLPRRASFEVSGSRARRLVSVDAPSLRRRVLLLRDGPWLYELFLEAEPADSALAESLDGIAAGFTILSPRGSVEPDVPTPEEAKPEELEHEFYRIRLLKPDGFVQKTVEPAKDPGIIYRFRRMDRHKNLAEIRVRAFLLRTLKEDVEAKAAAALEDFRKRYLDVKAPRSPRRASKPGAKRAFRLRMAGKTPRTGLVVQEERLFLEHENGWVYDVQVRTFLGADREFRKELEAFWRSLRFRPR